MTAEEPDRSGRRHEHRRRAAAHAKPATSTPPTRCERRGHPLLLAPPSCLVPLSVGTPSSRQLPSASSRCLPKDGAASRLAGESLEPWLPQAASTRRTRSGRTSGCFAGRTEGHPAPRRRALRRARVAPQVRCAGTPTAPRRVWASRRGGVSWTVLSRPSSRGRVSAGVRARESKPAAPQRAMASTAPWRCPARRPSASRRALWLVML
jgi:hypothetical protein